MFTAKTARAAVLFAMIAGSAVGISIIVRSFCQYYQRPSATARETIIIPASPVTVNQEQLKTVSEYYPRLEVAVRTGNGQYIVAPLVGGGSGASEKNGQELQKLINAKGTEDLTFLICIPYKERKFEMPIFQSKAKSFSTAHFGYENGNYFALVDGQRLAPSSIGYPSGSLFSLPMIDRVSDPRDDGPTYHVEPQGIEFRAANSRFLGATVHVRTKSGVRSGKIPWGDCTKTETIRIPNPGNLQGGYTLTIVRKNGTVWKFKGKHTSAYETLSFHGVTDMNGTPDVFIEQDVHPYRLDDWRTLTRVK